VLDPADLPAPVPHSVSGDAPSPWVVALLLGLISLVWGSTWLVIRVGIEDVPPLTGAGIRFVLAGSVMALLAPAIVRREGGGRPPVAAILLHAGCQFCVNYALVYWAETVLPSGLVSVLWSAFPLMMGLLGHFVTASERLGARKWVGLLVSFCGIVLLFATDLRSIGRDAVGMGLAVLLAPAAVAVSTTYVKRHAAGSSSVLLNRDAMLLGGVMLLAMALVFERGQRFEATPAAIGSILYLTLAGTVLTFGVYLWLLRTVPAYRMSLTSYVTPVIALFVGAAFGGEPLGATTLGGTALVVVGLALALGRAPRSMARGR
jgi:drug/metabolite transporter (DMT)-like permease